MASQHNEKSKTTEVCEPLILPKTTDIKGHSDMTAQTSTAHVTGQENQATFQKKPNKCSPLQLLKTHYGSTNYNRTEAELEREKYLIPRCVPFNRWWLIPAAVIIQFCCGSLYAWSVYNEPIEKYMYGNQSNTAAVTFYLAVGGLGTSASVFGPWLERNGPCKTALLGTVGFFLGNLLAGLAVYVKKMWLLYIGYGMIGGCSIGICYISPVSALQKFFPDRRGMASGFAVCGFGAGSIAASPLQLLLMNRVGVPLTFVILGACYFCLMMVASTILRVPPPGFTVNGLTVEGVKERASVQLKKRPAPILKLTLIQSLKSRDFWLMFVMFCGNLITGLVVLSRLASMVQNIFGKSKADGALVVSINGFLNLCGRFVFSLLSDKIGRKTVYLLTLGTQIIILIAMHPILNNKESTYWIFVSLIWVMSACYGSTFGVIPAFLADMFGSSNIGACHGVMLIGWSIGGIGGGLIYTAIYNSLVPRFYTTKHVYPYLVNFEWLLAIVIIGFLFAFFIRTNPWHRLLAKVDPKRVLYFSMCQRLLRINLCKEKISRVHLMNKREMMEECDNMGGVNAFQAKLNQRDDEKLSGNKFEESMT